MTGNNETSKTSPISKNNNHLHNNRTTHILRNGNRNTNRRITNARYVHSNRTNRNTIRLLGNTIRHRLNNLTRTRVNNVDNKRFRHRRRFKTITSSNSLLPTNRLITLNSLRNTRNTVRLNARVLTIRRLIVTTLYLLRNSLNLFGVNKDIQTIRHMRSTPLVRRIALLGLTNRRLTLRREFRNMNINEIRNTNTTRNINSVPRFETNFRVTKVRNYNTNTLKLRRGRATHSRRTSRQRRPFPILLRGRRQNLNYLYHEHFHTQILHTILLLIPSRRIPPVEFEPTKNNLPSSFPVCEYDMSRFTQVRGHPGFI